MKKQEFLSSNLEVSTQKQKLEIDEAFGEGSWWCLACAICAADAASPAAAAFYAARDSTGGGGGGE